MFHKAKAVINLLKKQLKIRRSKNKKIKIVESKVNIADLEKR